MAGEVFTGEKAIQCLWGKVTEGQEGRQICSMSQSEGDSAAQEGVGNIGARGAEQLARQETK